MLLTSSSRRLMGHPQTSPQSRAPSTSTRPRRWRHRGGLRPRAADARTATSGGACSAMRRACGSRAGGRWLHQLAASSCRCRPAPQGAPGSLTVLPVHYLLAFTPAAFSRLGSFTVLPGIPGCPLLHDCMCAHVWERESPPRTPCRRDGYTPTPEGAACAQRCPPWLLDCGGHCAAPRAGCGAAPRDLCKPGPLAACSWQQRCAAER